MTPSSEEIDWAREAHKEGIMSISEIARECHSSVIEMARILGTADDTTEGRYRNRPSGHTRGPHSKGYIGTMKMDIARVRHNKGRGESAASLAREVGVSRQRMHARLNEAT